MVVDLSACFQGPPTHHFRSLPSFQRHEDVAAKDWRPGGQSQSESKMKSKTGRSFNFSLEGILKTKSKTSTFSYYDLDSLHSICGQVYNYDSKYLYNIYIHICIHTILFNDSLLKVMEEMEDSWRNFVTMESSWSSPSHSRWTCRSQEQRRTMSGLNHNLAIVCRWFDSVPYALKRHVHSGINFWNTERLYLEEQLQSTPGCNHWLLQLD